MLYTYLRHWWMMIDVLIHHRSELLKIYLVKSSRFQGQIVKHTLRDTYLIRFFRSQKHDFNRTISHMTCNFHKFRRFIHAWQIWINGSRYVWTTYEIACHNQKDNTNWNFLAIRRPECLRRSQQPNTQFPTFWTYLNQLKRLHSQLYQNICYDSRKFICPLN